MKTISITEANHSLAEYARGLHGPLVITAHGKPIAALVPIENMDLETLAVSTSPRFVEVIERSRRRAATEGEVSAIEIRRRLGLAAKRNNKAASPRGKMKPKAR